MRLLYNRRLAGRVQKLVLSDHSVWRNDHHDPFWKAATTNFLSTTLARWWRYRLPFYLRHQFSNTA